MFAKCFSAGLCLSVAFGIGPAAAEPPAASDRVALELAQARVKEHSLDDLPAVDKDRGPPPSRATRPPPPPPVPPAPRVTTRTPPPGDEETSPPAREVPPPPGTATRRNPPPPRLNETSDTRRADTTRRAEPPPRLEEPPPREARRPPPSKTADRSAFYAKCTEQCHLSCEAAFEACNGDSSPAKPACVRKLESCRVERCSCSIQ